MVTSLLTKIPIATDNLISNKIRPTGYVCPSMITTMNNEIRNSLIMQCKYVMYQCANSNITMIMNELISANGWTVQSSKISRRDYGYNSSMSSVQIDQLC